MDSLRLFQPTTQFPLQLTLVSGSESTQILLPLHGKEVFLLTIALLANYRHIAFGGPTASDNGHDMIHGEFPGREVTPTVMTDSTAQPLFPPPRFAESSSLLPLSSDLSFTDIHYEWIRHL